jgi:predicted DsbA family dithiol-disulfide isomerase
VAAVTAALDLSSAADDDPRLPNSADTIVVYADLNCSFAHVAVQRLHEMRSRLGLDGVVHFDHRAFPLELFNLSVNERPGVDSEIAVVGAIEPAAGWRLWQGPDWRYPVTMLPPLEAVQAAKSQGWAASEQLDRSLRKAFWEQHRCISLRHEILDIAQETGVIDVDDLARLLDAGSSRADVIAQFRAAENDNVICSPHVFLADRSNYANPGVQAHWVNGGFGEGFPVIDADDPAIYEAILTRAAGLAGNVTEYLC